MDMHVEVVVPARGDNIFKSEKLLVSKKVSLSPETVKLSG